MMEVDARTKWCPHNLGQFGSSEDGKCIGSACMMWESWEYLDPKDPRNKPLLREGEGECGLKSKDLEVNYP